MRHLIIGFLLLYFFQSNAQDNRISRDQYISMYKDIAIQEMRISSIPASITLAQGILESGDGNSALAKKANNHFGIKCHGWNGEKVYHDDDKKQECFRRYKKVSESYRDHSEFLKKSRYAALFDLKVTDYKGWAKGLKKAGYATNPKYPELLISLIERHKLFEYDSQTGKNKKDKKVKKSKVKIENAKPKSKRIGDHAIKMHENNIKYILIKESDSFEKIAEEFNMGEWQLYKYNDWSKDQELYSTGVLFLQPKRGKAKNEFHITERGQSLWDVSQLHGIKLKKLLRKNGLEANDKIETGTKLYLRKKKK